MTLLNVIIPTRSNDGGGGGGGDDCGGDDVEASPFPSSDIRADTADMISNGDCITILLSPSPSSSSRTVVFGGGGDGVGAGNDTSVVKASGTVIEDGVEIGGTVSAVVVVVSTTGGGVLDNDTTAGVGNNAGIGNIARVDTGDLVAIIGDNGGVGDNGADNGISGGIGEDTDKSTTCGVVVAGAVVMATGVVLGIFSNGDGDTKDGFL